MAEMSDYQEALAALEKDFAEALELLEICRMCDLIYGMHYNHGYGIGNKVAGVTIKDDTTVADVVDDFLAKHSHPTSKGMAPR